MSTCISKHGEYSDHGPLDDEFYCTWCGELDEAAMRKGIEAAVREQVAREIEEAEVWAVRTDLLDRWGTSLGGRRIMSPHRAHMIVQLVRADAARIARGGAA